MIKKQPVVIALILLLSLMLVVQAWLWLTGSAIDEPVSDSDPFIASSGCQSPPCETLASQQLSMEQRQTIEQVLMSDQPPPVDPSVFTQLPRSLQGSPLPSQLAIHADGNLVIQIAIRHYFDYFLTAIGEEPLSLIAARVRFQLTQELAPPALSQALTIFADYIAYRDTLAYLLNQQQQDQQLLRAQIEAARVEHFDPLVINAFFADEDSYGQYMNARSQLSQDPSLSIEERQQRAAQLLAAAPAWLQQQQATANQLSNFQRQRDQLLAETADPAQLQQLREQTFGAEAADRLAELADRRVIWQQQLADYHQQLEDLLAADMDEDDLQAEILGLREYYFNPTEILRVQAIDKQTFGEKLP